MNQQALSFDAVQSRPPALPSWMAPPDPSVGRSLAPPGVPQDLMDDEEEAGGFEPDVSFEALEALRPAESEPPPPSSAAAGGEAQPRRDTLIEELIPRAEEEAVALIQQAVEELAASRQAMMAQSEAQMVDLVRTIARRVIAREVSLDPSIVQGLVQEGLAALGQRDRVVVRLGTFFAPAVYELREQLKSSGMHCEVSIDEGLGETGCRLSTDLGAVDESIETRLAALLEGALGSAS